VEEVIRATGLDQEEDLTLDSKEVRLPSKKDCLNMEKFAKRTGPFR